MYSNWDKIVKDPWSAVGYFGVGAIGGMMATMPGMAASAVAVTAAGNTAVDIAYGNMPDFNKTMDGLNYFADQVFSGFSVLGAGEIAKSTVTYALSKGWFQTSKGVASPARLVGGESISMDVTKEMAKANVKSGVLHYDDGAIEIISFSKSKIKPVINPVSVAKKVVSSAADDAARASIQYSDDLVKASQQAYPKLAGKVQLHHPIPQYLGGARNQVLVPLDAAYHQQITNTFRAEWGYGLAKPSETKLLEILNTVYSKYPLPK